MTSPWPDALVTYRKRQHQKFKVYLTKGVQVNPKAYCCDDNTINDQKPPVALLTVTPNPIYEGDNATLDLTGSYDPDGAGIADPAGYELWDGIGGNYPTTRTQVVNYPNAGRYECIGVVVDDDGFYGQASVWLEVLSENGDNPPEPPPGPDPEGVGKRLIAATNPYGIAVCLDRFAAPPIWAALNDGLAGANLQIVDLIIDPWNINRALICTATGDVFENTDIWGGGSWSSIYDASVEGPCDHDNKAVRVRKGSKDENFVLLVVEGQDVSHNPVVYIVHSHTDGGAWPTAVQLSNAGVASGWRCEVAMLDQEVGGSLIASSHDADVVFVSGMSGKGVAWNMSPTVWKSTNKAHTMPVLQYERDADAAATNKCVPIKVPFDNNPTDQKILIGCWYVQQAPAKKGPYYVEDGLADDPVAGDEFPGFPGGHELVDDTVPPRGSHGIATWAQAHVKLFTQTAGPNYHVILSDDWGRTFLVRAIVDPAAAAFKMRCNSTFPYDPNIFVIGRAQTTTNYLILLTESAGVSFSDLTGNLRVVLAADGAAPYPSMRITQIVFDWLS